MTIKNFWYLYDLSLFDLAWCMWVYFIIISVGKPFLRFLTKLNFLGVFYSSARVEIERVYLIRGWFDLFILLYQDRIAMEIYQNTLLSIAQLAPHSSLASPRPFIPKIKRIDFFPICHHVGTITHTGKLGVSDTR